MVDRDENLVAAAEVVGGEPTVPGNDLLSTLVEAPSEPQSEAHWSRRVFLAVALTAVALAGSDNIVIKDVAPKPVPHQTQTIEPHGLMHSFSDVKHSPAKTDPAAGLKLSKSAIATIKQRLAEFPPSRTIPANVEAIMNRDTAFTDDCSAELVRNAAGIAIGLERAQHCDNRRLDSPWTVTKSGGVQLTYTQPLYASVGNRFDHLSYVGDITQIKLSNDVANTVTKQYTQPITTDLEFGAFRGHTASEVETAYNTTRLTPSEISSLPIGTRIYNSGWPGFQSNVRGELHRQDFAMTYMGTETDIDTGSKSAAAVEVALAAVPESADGAECSFGDSGSEGFAMQTVKLANGSSVQIKRPVGALSRFIDFGLVLKQHDNRTDDSASYNFNLNGYSALCGFAFLEPGEAAGSNAVTANVLAPSEAAILLQQQRQEQLDKLNDQYQAEFADPAIPKRVINGFVRIDSFGYPSYFDRPVVFYDKPTDTVLIGTYNEISTADNYKTEKCNVELIALTGPAEYGSLRIFERQNGVTPDFLQTSGAISADAYNGYYTDETGLPFSTTIPFDFNPITQTAAPSNLIMPGPESSLTVNNGQLALSPVDSVTPPLDAEAIDAEFVFTKLEDPIEENQILDGTLAITNPTSGNLTFIHDPQLYYGPDTNNAYLVYDGSKSHVTVTELPLNQIKISRNDSRHNVNLTSRSGYDFYYPDPSGRTYGYYKLDGRGPRFGEQLVNAPTDFTTYKTLAYLGGKFVLKPLATTNPTPSPSAPTSRIAPILS